MSGTEIAQAEADGRGAFFIERDGKRIALMTYQRTGPDRVTVVHTEVDPVLQGQGIARKLLDAAVGWARESGNRIVPQCAYAKA